MDYHGELTVQDFRHRYLVIYNAAGTNLSAARVDRRSLSVPLGLDAKLYWGHCKTLKEADYLAAILNSEAVNEAIKPFQTTGLMGERDIHKKVLDVPIPLFRPEDAIHQALADLGARAKAEAESYIADRDLPKSLAGRRGAVRNELSVVLKEIDDRVRDLIF